MKSVNAKTISNDYDFVILTAGSRDEKFLNYSLVPIISFLPEDLRADMENVWVVYDDEETDSSKCLIELIYDGIVYRHINPFTERKITSMFEDKPLDSNDAYEIGLLWNLFPKVKIEFILTGIDDDEQEKVKNEQLHNHHQINIKFDLEKLKMEYSQAFYGAIGGPAECIK